MKIIVKKTIILSWFFSLSVFALAQVISPETDLKSYLRSKEKTDKEQILKTISKQENAKEIKEFSLSVTSFGSFNANLGKYKLSLIETEGLFHTMFKLDGSYTFGQLSSYIDELGFQHTNYLVYYKGYPIDGQMVMAHQKDGFVNSINGIIKAVKNINLDIPSKRIDAFEIAKKELKVTDLVDIYPVERVVVRVNQKDGEKFKLADKVKIFSIVPLKKYNVYVDVQSGEIIKKVSLIPHADVACTGQTYYNGEQTITCDLQNGTYKLKDNARKIGTYDGTNWNGRTMPTTLFTNSSNNWSAANLKPAVQVHWAMGKTYDYYMNTFNRNSYDNNQGQIYNIYNPTVLDDEGMAFNAAALGHGIMLYGRGGTRGSITFRPMVALDVAGHEFAHLVTGESNARGLEYEGESGALNESFSDIFGTCIDFYAVPATANWLMGEGIISNMQFLRSMSEPSSSLLPVDYRQPDTYLGEYWETGIADHGGVHTNSGVQNKWFYLLVNGGTGTNDRGNAYSVRGIGMDSAQRIAYRTLMHYLPQKAQYVDAFNLSLQATRDLYGDATQTYQSVVDAWYAVGIDASTPRLCMGETVVTEASGTITDGSGTIEYFNGKDCSWKIRTTQGRVIKLTFTAFDLEPVSDGTMYDYVAVYDGATIGSNLLGKYSGNTIPPELTSSGANMLIVFHTDAGVTAQGFEANYITYGLNSLDQAISNNIRIFPNPSTDEINVVFQNNSTQATIVIRDMLGKTVKTLSFKNISENQTQSIDVGELASGMYVVQIIADKLNEYKKIIIKK